MAMAGAGSRSAHCSEPELNPSQIRAALPGTFARWDNLGRSCGQPVEARWVVEVRLLFSSTKVQHLSVFGARTHDQLWFKLAPPQELGVSRGFSTECDYLRASPVEVDVAPGIGWSASSRFWRRVRLLDFVVAVRSRSVSPGWSWMVKGLKGSAHRRVWH